MSIYDSNNSYQNMRCIYVRCNGELFKKIRQPWKSKEGQEPAGLAMPICGPDVYLQS